MDEDIIGIIAGFLIVFVPVAGITLRIAVKPVAEAFTKYMQVKQGTEGLELVERRLALLEQELGAMRNEVSHLSEEREFYRKLASPGQAKETPRVGAGG